MSKQATTDEDLIILSEDTETENSFDDIKLDIPEESDNSEVITFGEEEVSTGLDQASDETASEEEIVLTLDDESAEEKVEVTDVQEVVETETNSEVSAESDDELGLDFSLDFDESAEEKTQEATEQVVEEKSTDASESLDLWSFDLTASDDEVSSEVPIAEAVVVGGSMNSILEETVAKLQARKDAIAWEKSWKTAKVADLKAEIKKLEEEVVALEVEVEWLDHEAEKISLNMSSLEDMKLEEEESVREHNYESVKA